MLNWPPLLIYNQIFFECSGVLKNMKRQASVWRSPWFVFLEDNKIILTKEGKSWFCWIRHERRCYLGHCKERHKETRVAEVEVGPTIHVVCLYFQKAHIATWTFWKYKYITKVSQLHKYAIVKRGTKAQGWPTLKLDQWICSLILISRKSS